MPENINADDQAIIEKALQSIRSKDRHSVPSHKVKLFFQMIGDELDRTGSLKKEYVDGLIQRLKSEEL